MALIEWNDSLSVNVAEIDKQHQRLIQMINELNDAMRQRKANEILGKVISGLADYTEYHFSAEEKYFDKFGYPEAATHKREHQAFVKQVSDFKDRFDQGQLTLSTNIMFFMGDWLKNHIQGSDKRYGPFFNEKGLT